MPEKKQDNDWQSGVLPWFAEQWQLWLNQLRLKKLPNALLLTGTSGSGKYALASAFAHVSLCQQPSADSACGFCKSCHLVGANSHPDLLTVQPEEGSRSVKIDQVRQLAGFVQSKPQIGPRRVVILRPAEAMNIYAANAILKTLEEPPGAALIMLIVQQASLLLPTIRSRCQIAKLPAPSLQQASEWLAAEAGMSTLAAMELLHTVGGQPMTALACHQAQEKMNKQDVLAHWADYLAGQQDAFSVAAKWAKLNTDWILTWLGGWLKEILQSQSDSRFLLPEQLQILAGKLSCETVWNLYQELLEIKKSVYEQRNLNMQLVFEHWLLLNKSKLNKNMR